MAYVGIAAASEGNLSNLRGSILRKLVNLVLGAPGYGNSAINPEVNPTGFCAQWGAESSCTSMANGGNYCEWDGSNCTPLPYVAAQSDPIAFCGEFSGSESDCESAVENVEFCKYYEGKCYAGYTASRTNPEQFCSQFKASESVCNSAATADGGANVCVWNGDSCIVDGFVVDTTPSFDNDD
eukprot:33951_1